MMDADLKEYLSVSLGTLTQEINRLTALVERQSTMIREIEIRSTTRVAELQKDVEEIRRDVLETRAGLRDLGDSQKFKWKTLSEERAAEKKDRESKDRMQAIKNNQMDTVNKLLWAILIIVIGMALSFLWEMIKSGGLRGMIT